MPNGRRVMVIGLDCVPPRLAFEDWADRLPHLSKLRAQGLSGPLRSVDPPVTVPAWMCMMTGHDPGMLGIYGFRNRLSRQQTGLEVVNAQHLTAPPLWDHLGKAGLRSITLGVPLTWPPRAISGIQVGCFLAPSSRVVYTFPRGIQQELDRVTGGYMADVRDFRKLDRPALLAQLHEMTRRRFLAARHLATRQAWDFFMLVEMGPDRIHHCFWRFMDPRHPAYTPGHPFEFAIRDYYEALDREVGALLAAIPDDVAVLVVSDHGARAMQGGFALNQWLLEQGYLVLKAPPASPGPLQIDQIDFSRTKAWGDGGYYGRVFLNVQGREPEGIVPQTEAETLRATLKEALENTTDENGRHLGTQVLLPEQLYREVKGVPPDLLVYFGALDWRAVGSVGLPSIWTRENDTGPDDANHDPLGIFIWKDPQNPGKGEHRDGLSLLDITPGLLKYYGLEVPAELPGSGW